MIMHEEQLEESSEMTTKREEVLKELEKIVKDWIIEETKNQNMSPETANARIFSFGSYKLGVHSPGSDIDALCVSPSHITRNLFFDSLLSILRKTTGITELNPIQDAQVPIIKMKFHEVEIDLL